MEPKIVCLCGSTRFKEAFVKANRDETLKGNIVLSVGMFGHQEGIDMNGEVKKRLDQLHFRKIDLAHEVLVLNVGGYIGESTRNEINYSLSKHKPIRYLEPILTQTDMILDGKDWVKSLEEFHAKMFGDIVSTVKSWPKERQLAFLKFRIGFMQEELDELKESQNGEDAVDAIIDLCVVAIGTLHAFGIDAREAWKRVHLANMMKVPGANPKRPNEFNLPDCVKPEGWMPPRHMDNVGLLKEIFE